MNARDHSQPHYLGQLDLTVGIRSPGAPVFYFAIISSILEHLHLLIKLTSREARRLEASYGYNLSLQRPLIIKCDAFYFLIKFLGITLVNNIYKY